MNRSCSCEHDLKQSLDAAITVNPEIFMIILFLPIALKDILATLKILRLEHDLPISVINRVRPIRQDFIFMKLRSFAKLKPMRKYVQYVNCQER